MKRTSHTQSAELTFHAEATAFKPAHKPKLTMIWVTEWVGDRTRLIARWTTQD